ncbi:MAG: hypothetical protein RI637_02380, partial [Acidimicrobiia bacterium]|nr:hypothetical protein [Acidimicrobiia bacterium]
VVLLAAGGIVGVSGGVIYFSLRTMGWLKQVPQVRAIVEESEMALTRVERRVVEIAGPLVRRAGESVRRVRRRSTAVIKSTSARAGRHARNWAKEARKPRQQTRQSDRSPQTPPDE